MKHFSSEYDVVFQGELAFVRVDSIPQDAKQAKDLIVGHSETGHHHVFQANPSVFRYTTADELVQYLDIKPSTKPAVLQHLREDHTHEAFTFPPGTYKVLNQRESTPLGWRKALD